MEIFRDELAKAEWVKIRFKKATGYGVRYCQVFEVGPDAARLALHGPVERVKTPLVIIIPISEIAAMEING